MPITPFARSKLRDLITPLDLHRRNVRYLKDIDNREGPIFNIFLHFLLDILIRRCTTSNLLHGRSTALLFIPLHSLSSSGAYARFTLVTWGHSLFIAGLDKYNNWFCDFVSASVLIDNLRIRFSNLQRRHRAHWHIHRVGQSDRAARLRRSLGRRVRSGGADALAAQLYGADAGPVCLLLRGSSRNRPDPHSRCDPSYVRNNVRLILVFLSMKFQHKE